LLFERGVIVSYETIRRWCDKAAAERFFKHVLTACPDGPRRIVTDQLRSCPAAKVEIAEFANVRHVFTKASTRVNNRAENSHQPTHERERRMRGFRLPERLDCLRRSLLPSPARLSSIK
jgi:putative transposase